MPQKCKITKLNQRGEFKTWHFTSELMLTHEINADINRIATDNLIVADAQNLLVTRIMNEARPAWVTYSSWRFSRVDAMSWISNTKAKLPLTALPFEGYIQTNHTIDLPRLQWTLHQRMPDAVWEPVRGRLTQSAAYKQFSAANYAFEYFNNGSPALSRGGRPKKVTAVSTGHGISFFCAHCPVPTMIFS